jgi:hypothetical protein
VPAGSADGKPSPPPRIGFDFSKIPIFSPLLARIQPKLEINVPGDKYEQEADRVAEQVMRMPEPVVQRMPPTQQPYSFTVQRKCDACAKEEEKETLQAKSAGNTGGIVAPGLAQQIQSTRGGGQPMDAATRSFMETRFGTDFGGVRIHTDINAALFSQRLQARAFTLGSDVYFNQGQYKPDSLEGKRLIAHELTHTIQQEKWVQRKIQRVPGSPAGGCGVCYGSPMLAGRVAHAFIQEEFQALYPYLLSEHYILSVLPQASSFRGGFLDLAVLESTDQIAIGEIKPANAEGLVDGEAKLALYETALRALGMRVRRMNYPPPLFFYSFSYFRTWTNLPTITRIIC